MPTHGGLAEENEKKKNAKAQCFSIFLLVYERGCGEKEAGVCRVSGSPRDSSRNFEPARRKRLCFCKESSERKRQFRFGIAKAAVLHCKTAAFTVQNLRFWNVKQ